MRKSLDLLLTVTVYFSLVVYNFPQQKRFTSTYSFMSWWKGKDLSGLYLYSILCPWFQLSFVPHQMAMLSASANHKQWGWVVWTYYRRGRGWPAAFEWSRVWFYDVLLQTVFSCLVRICRCFDTQQIHGHFEESVLHGLTSAGAVVNIPYSTILC